eukprot:c5017_g1_i1 orf=1-213(-)
MNYVLLVPFWYVDSCWCFTRRCISQLRRLLWNFLWMDSNGSLDTKERVAWDTIVLPQSEGGLGVFDPERQI